MEKSLYPEEMWPELYFIYPNDFPVPTEEQLFAIESMKIRQRYAILMDDIVKPYTKTEQLTWDTQVKEADAYLLDNQADVPMISALAQNRGVALADLVTWIKDNEVLYRVAVGTLLGQQQAELDQLYNK
jgi:hypothetical protein